jgi:hypothetical protein
MHNCEKQQKVWPYWIKCYDPLTTVLEAKICTYLNVALYVYYLSRLFLLCI